MIAIRDLGPMIAGGTFLVLVGQSGSPNMFGSHCVAGFEENSERLIGFQSAHLDIVNNHVDTVRIPRIPSDRKVRAGDHPRVGSPARQTAPVG